MTNRCEGTVAVIDYGLGNLYSVANACRVVGIEAVVTKSPAEIVAADGLILPGVGAFGVAMERLNALELADPIRQFAESGKPLLGICLGMQLLLTKSLEFGEFGGLDILKGQVKPLPTDLKDAGRPLKIPHVGWTKVYPPEGVDWQDSCLKGLSENDYLYFVHSYYVEPDGADSTIAIADFGSHPFCAAIQREQIIGCQFHPEKSGNAGLSIYKHFAALL